MPGRRTDLGIRKQLASDDLRAPESTGVPLPRPSDPPPTWRQTVRTRLSSIGRSQVPFRCALLGIAALALTLAAPWQALRIRPHRQARNSRQLPSAPTHIAGPRSATYSHQARFLWRAPQLPVRGFRCRLDRRSLTRCQSGIVYRHLRAGWHSFTVLAMDGDGHLVAGVGNLGAAPPSWRWRIMPSTGGVTVAGNAASPLYPGAAPSRLDLIIFNHRDAPVLVKHLTVTIKTVEAPHNSASSKCTSADFAARAYGGPPFLAPVGTSTLRKDRVPERLWPTLQMLDLPVNQDGCAEARLKLAYNSIFATQKRRAPLGKAHR